MKKYIIYGVARTGSMYYTHLLDEYYKSCLFLNNNVFYSHNYLEPDWSFPINHTHQIGIIENYPKDFVFLLTTRSILDSVISLIVAEKTKIYTLTSTKEELLYKKQHKNLKLDISIREFTNKVKDFDHRYSKILQIYENINTEKYIIKYNDCANNENNFFKNIGIDIPSNFQFSTIKKMSVNKFLMVEHLHELLDVYKKINVKNNFEDEITIDKIKKLY
jgi:hypothetical protein